MAFRLPVGDYSKPIMQKSRTVEKICRCAGGFRVNDDPAETRRYEFGFVAIPVERPRRGFGKNRNVIG